MAKSDTSQKPSGKIRCAIYTRKSTEEEFNSLDAQYEACAAYIASQKHEGWGLFLTAMMMAGSLAVI